MTEGQATLMRDSGTGVVTLDQLRQIPCPEPEGIWRPVPHADIVDLVRSVAGERGLSAPDALTQVSVNRTGTQMFGVMGIADAEGDSEYGFAVGFRNSHDKSLSLRIVLGVRVFVCDNLCMHGHGDGSFDERRLHTVNIDPTAIINRAFDGYFHATERVAARYDALRSTSVTFLYGEHLLYRAVEMGALPKTHLFDAHMAWQHAYDLDVEGTRIEHPRTAWALQQVVTTQWKKNSMMGLERRSSRLDSLLDEFVL